MAQSITASVGVMVDPNTGAETQAFNVVADQLVVMRLLNRIPEAQGGTLGVNGPVVWSSPQPGVCDPSMRDAIFSFQQTHSPPLFVDGHIDPASSGGVAIGVMNDLAEANDVSTPLPTGSIGTASVIEIPEMTISKDEELDGDSFEIRMLGSLALGVPIAGIKFPALSSEFLFFQIWDATNDLSGFYAFTTLPAGSIGVGLLPLSVTLAGPWNAFTTPRLAKATNFAGKAAFATFGVATFSVNRLSLTLKTDDGLLFSIDIDLQTGFTVGVGGSIAAGNMVLFPEKALAGGHP